MKILIGTRGSVLARAQARLVIDALARHHPQVEFQVRVITSAGDRDRKIPLPETPSVGFFTRELELALVARTIDVAVHSLKDLPTRVDPSLVLAAVPERASPCDCLVSARSGAVGTFSSLPLGARVGTSSPRRRAQLLALRSDLVVLPLRGNVNTRLRKLREGRYDAVVVARAALERLDLAEDALDLPLDDFLPAPAQGALGVQARCADATVLDILASIDHLPTRACVTAEREVLLALGGGCSLPIGALARILGPDRLELRSAVFSRDGRRKLCASARRPVGEPRELGREVAEELLRAGALTL